MLSTNDSIVTHNFSIFINDFDYYFKSRQSDRHTYTNWVGLETRVSISFCDVSTDSSIEMQSNLFYFVLLRLPFNF